jgi:hypothetical protein
MKKMELCNEYRMMSMISCIITNMLLEMTMLAMLIVMLIAARWMVILR